MTVRVEQLVSELRNRSRATSVRLGDVELIANGNRAGSLRAGDEFLPWDDRAAQMLMAHLQGPAYKYLRRQPLERQRAIIGFHTGDHADNESMWYMEGDSVAGIYQPDSKVIPLSAVAERIANVFDPDDLVDVLYAPDQVEVNVTSQIKTITVPGIEGFAGRPLDNTVEDPHTGRKVGDLSAGGIRVIIQPGKPERAPVVQEFWKRLVCTNGMTRMISGSQIKLRGRTVPEILDEMENVARAVFEGLDASGQAILHSAFTPVPGATSDFIRQVATERGINPRHIVRLQERAAGLPANPTVYDVTQVITAMANEEEMSVSTRRNLQAIGGDLTVDTSRMIHRCVTCERPLDA